MIVGTRAYPPTTPTPIPNVLEELNSNTPLSFAVGDTLHWHVDLTPAYPRGVLCSRVQARLFPAIPDEESIPRPLLSEIGLVVAEGNPAPVAVEVGREYKISLALRPEHVLWAADHLLPSTNTASFLSLSLDCFPVIGSNDASSPPPPKHLDVGTPLVLAVSESFILQPAGLGSALPSASSLANPAKLRTSDFGSSFYRHRSSSPGPLVEGSTQSGSITDITPLDDLHESKIKCPISQTRPGVPVRVGEDTIYDRDALIVFLESVEQMDMAQPFCPLQNVLDNVCVDRQHLFKLQKYTAHQMDIVLEERACVRSAALDNIKLNLQTARLFVVDLGLNGDAVSFAEILLRHSAGPGLSRLSKSMRKYAKATMKGIRYVLPAQTLLRRALTTSSIVVVMTLCQMSATTSTAPIMLAATAVMGPGLLPFSNHQELIRKAISRVAAFVLLHATDWAVRYMQSNPYLDDKDLERVLDDFIDALRRLEVEPFFNASPAKPVDQRTALMMKSDEVEIPSKVQTPEDEDEDGVLLDYPSKF